MLTRRGLIGCAAAVFAAGRLRDASAAESLAASRKAAPLPNRPDPAGWQLVFSDEFDGDKLDADKWQCESGSPGHIQSSRWPENIVVKDGCCRLLTRKEKRGGKEWTSGHFWTRSFAPRYGFFECRMKTGGAAGLNNAFWLMADGKKDDGRKFEIDICESHFPDKVNTNLHWWGGEHWAKSFQWKAPFDLSTRSHTLGLEWTQDELLWYFDGKQVRRQEHTICRSPARVRFSTAVMPWAGKITDALDGTSMIVDYVRVWQRK